MGWAAAPSLIVLRSVVPRTSRRQDEVGCLPPAPAGNYGIRRFMRILGARCLPSPPERAAH